MSIASNTPIQFVPGIGRRTATVLHELDIHTFGQLAHIPEQVLIEIFGPSITRVTSFQVATQYEGSKKALPTTTHSSFWKRFTLANKLASVL